MMWIVAALIWLALSIAFASFVGRFIRFGMTGEIKPSEPELHSIAELHPTI